MELALVLAMLEPPCRGTQGSRGSRPLLAGLAGFEALLQLWWGPKVGPEVGLRLGPGRG